MQNEHFKSSNDYFGKVSQGENGHNWTDYVYLSGHLLKQPLLMPRRLP